MSKSFDVTTTPFDPELGYDNNPIDFKDAITEHVSEDFRTSLGYIRKEPNPQKVLDLILKIIDTLSESQVKEIAKSYGWEIHRS